MCLLPGEEADGHTQQGAADGICLLWPEPLRLPVGERLGRDLVHIGTAPLSCSGENMHIQSIQSMILDNLLSYSVYCKVFVWGCLCRNETCMFIVDCFQIKKLLNKPVVRESCYYRKLTDRGKDEPVPVLNEAQIENLTGELTSL